MPTMVDFRIALPEGRCAAYHVDVDMTSTLTVW